MRSVQRYTTGNHVAFKASPNLHTAAHEAAHVVQQRRGVQLQDGVGQLDDAYEKHADAVADLVIQGHSAEDLLWDSAILGASSRNIQMRTEECHERTEIEEIEGETSRCQYNDTHNWSLRLVLNAGIHIIGGGAALVFELRNRTTGQESQGLIGGVGIGGSLGGGGSADVTEDESDWVDFRADLDGMPVTFSDFERKVVLFGSIGVVPIYGYGFTVIRIPQLNTGPIRIIGWSMGFGGSISVDAGTVIDLSPTPDVYCRPREYDITEEEECFSVMDIIEREYRERMTFNTGSAELDEYGRRQLEVLADRIAQDILNDD